MSYLIIFGRNFSWPTDLEVINSALMKAISMAYKFKLMPTSKQQDVFSSWAGTCRFLYNLGLEHRILSWNHYRKSFNYYEQANELKNLKTCEGFEWIKNSPAQILQQSLKDLDKAFKSFWKSGFGFPKYKKKSLGDSFRFPDAKQLTEDTLNLCQQRQQV